MWFSSLVEDDNWETRQHVDIVYSCTDRSHFSFFLFFLLSVITQRIFCRKRDGKAWPQVFTEQEYFKWVSAFHYFLPEFSPAFFIRHFCESSAYRSACRSLSNSRCLFPSGPNLLINKYSWITQSQAHYLEAILFNLIQFALKHISRSYWPWKHS